MGRRALVGSVSHALSASQLDQVGQSADLVNYVITVALTVMAIVMMNPNAVLSFVLTGKKK